MSVQIISTGAELESVKDDWDRLYRNAVERCPTLSHTWVCAWWDAFSAGRRLYVILVRESSTPVAAAPLLYMEKRLFNKKRKVISFLSNTWVDRTGILIAGREQRYIDAITGHLREAAPAWDILELAPLEAGSEVTQRLIRSLKARNIPLGIDESLQSPCLDIPGSWEALLKNLSPSFRQTVRRKIRKSAAIPGLEMTVECGPEAVDKIMNISLHTWQHDNGTSMASTPAVRAFYSRIMTEAARAGELYAGFAYVDGQPVAFEFNLLCDRTVHNFKLGYHKDYGHISPGIVLKSHVLKDIIDKNRQGRAIRQYDFMGETEPYKRNWTKAFKQHIHVRGFNKGPELRAAYIIVYKVKPLIKKLLVYLGLRQER